MRYHQITPAERYTLATLRKQVPRPSCAEIAELMGRHRSTIWRELHRNCSRHDGGYRTGRAQEQAKPDVSDHAATAILARANGRWWRGSCERSSALSKSADGCARSSCS